MADTSGQRDDMWTRDLATEGKELSSVTAAILQQHLRHDDERFAEQREMAAEATKSRHDIRNDMLLGFGEMRRLHADGMNEQRTTLADAVAAMNAQAAAVALENRTSNAAVALENRTANAEISKTMNSRFWSLAIAMIVFLVGVTASLIAAVSWLVTNGVHGISQ